VNGLADTFPQGKGEIKNVPYSITHAMKTFDVLEVNDYFQVAPAILMTGRILEYARHRRQGGIYSLSRHVKGKSSLPARSRHP